MPHELLQSVWRSCQRVLGLRIKTPENDRDINTMLNKFNDRAFSLNVRGDANGPDDVESGFPQGISSEVNELV